MAVRRGFHYIHAFQLAILFLLGTSLLGVKVQAKEELETYVSLDTAICKPDVSGMIAYWPMDDGNNATTFQEVINGYHGSCEGEACPVVDASPKINGAFAFDGSDEVDVPEFPGLDWSAADSFSFETWVNIPEETICDEKRVFMGRHAGAQSVWMGCSDLETAKFSMRDSDWVVFNAIGTTSIIDGNWHHVVGVRDGVAQTMQLYVDNVLEATTPTAFTGHFTSNQEFNIGFFDTDPFYWLIGRLDEVAVYNKALTADEVALHYYGGAGQSYCNTPPVITPVDAKISAEGDSPLFSVTASDMENNAFTLSASNLPDGITFSPATGQFSGTLSYIAHIGPAPYNVTVTAQETGADGMTGTMSFNWTVNDVNRAPAVNNPGTQNSPENVVINLQIVADDPDTDNSLIFSATGLPLGLEINPDTGKINGVISHKASPDSPYDVVVTVTDDAPFSDHVPMSVQTAFTWNVEEANLEVYIPFVGNGGQP